MNENYVALRRQLTPLHIWSIAFGCVIGWGAFINPGKKFLPNSGVAGTAIAMVLGALVMVVIAFSYAFMVPRYPKAGGEFIFTKMSFGKALAFVCGWFLVAGYLTNVPMDSTAIGLIVDGLDGPLDILKFGFHYKVAGYEIYSGELFLSSAILLLFGYLNIVGVKKAGNVQIALSLLLIVCVFTLFISSLASAKTKGINMQPIWGFDKKLAIASNATTTEIGRYAHRGKAGAISAILATFVITPWAYVGFDAIPQTTEELNFPFKKVSVLMFIAIAFGCFVYTANTAVSAVTLSNWPDRVMAGDWVLLIAAEELLGTFGKVLIGIGVTCAVLSGIMGFYLASSRLMYSMGTDGFLPRWFGVVDPKHGTPKNAILFCMLASLSGPILGREALGWFVDMSAIGASIGYFFTCASALVTSRKEEQKKVFLKTIAAVGTVLSAMFLVLQLIPIPGLSGVHLGKESYIMLGVWTVLGLLFYGWIRVGERK